MSIFVDRSTKLICQGITGSAGSFHAGQMLAYGTKLVGGVTPGKGGAAFTSPAAPGKSVPVFDTMAAAVKATGANASVIFVPPPFAADSILEAADSGVGLIVAITEGIPVLDMVRVKRSLSGRAAEVRLLGPNCPGVITPGHCKIGIMPGQIHLAGRVGVVSRSGTLTYEAVYQLTRGGHAASRPASGSAATRWPGRTSSTASSCFEADPGTDAIVLIGEIGGGAEERAADFIRREMKQAGGGVHRRPHRAPSGKRMGHAGAIISGGKGTASDKVEALRRAGAKVVDSPGRHGGWHEAARGLMPAPPRSCVCGPKQSPGLPHARAAGGSKLPAKPLPHDPRSSRQGEPRRRVPQNGSPRFAKDNRTRTDLPKREPPMAAQRTLSLIKPDGLHKAALGKIIARFEERGLKPVAMRLMRLTPTQAEGFYAVHRERPFFRSLVQSMTVGPILAMYPRGRERRGPQPRDHGGHRSRQGRAGDVLPALSAPPTSKRTPFMAAIRPRMQRWRSPISSTNSSCRATTGKK